MLDAEARWRSESRMVCEAELDADPRFLRIAGATPWVLDLLKNKDLKRGRGSA